MTRLCTPQKRYTSAHVKSNHPNPIPIPTTAITKSKVIDVSNFRSWLHTMGEVFPMHECGKCSNAYLCARTSILIVDPSKSMKNTSHAPPCNHALIAEKCPDRCWGNPHHFPLDIQELFWKGTRKTDQVGVGIKTSLNYKQAWYDM